MIELFESLIALAEHRTVTRAATYLHLSQSALSKRLGRLEREIGKKLVEQQGRFVVLTPYAEQILRQVKPVLAELRSILNQQVSDARGYLSIVVSQAAIITWAPDTLAKVRDEMPGLELEVSSSSGLSVLELVASGTQMLGLVRGTGESVPNLTAEWLFDEQIVIVPSGLTPLRFSKKERVNVMTVDPAAEVQGIINRKLSRLGKHWGITFTPSSTTHSSAAIVQLARAGFGHGIVAKSVALSLGVKEHQLMQFPSPGLSTPVSLIGRKTTFARPIVQSFLKKLRKNLPNAMRAD